ncbi:MAG: ribonuclease P protein component 1 [Methanomassiliicoccales archaeon]
MGKMNRRDFMRQEFIGLEVKVTSSSDASTTGVEGRVVDETKNTITIEGGGRTRMIPKPGNEFQFTYEGERITIRGREIQHRPEDRIKKIR